MKAVAYYRVSRPVQIESGAGLASQEDICKEWADKNGYEIKESFTEKAISGAAPIDKHPALFNAIYSLEAGDILLVSRLDRLSRDLYGGLLIDELVAKKKATVRSAAGEGTDSMDPGAVMMKSMFRLVAGFERNITQFRIKAALAAKRARGEPVGYIPFGFEVGADKKLHPKEEHQVVIRKIIEYRKEGLSLRSISNRLNEAGIYNSNGNPWNNSSMFNVLKRTEIGTKHPTRRSWS